MHTHTRAHTLHPCTRIHVRTCSHIIPRARTHAHTLHRAHTRSDTRTLLTLKIRVQVSRPPRNSGDHSGRCQDEILVFTLIFKSRKRANKKESQSLYITNAQPCSLTRLRHAGHPPIDAAAPRAGGPQGTGLPPAGGPDHLAQGLTSRRNQADRESWLPRRELCDSGLGRVILPSG